MSIRLKLIITYAVLVFISAAILLFAGITIVTGVVAATIDSVFDEGESHGAIMRTLDVLVELRQTDKYNPEDLKDPVFIEKISKESEFINGGIIVKYQDEIYNYGELPQDKSFYDKLVPTKDFDGYDRNDPDEEHLISEDGKKYYYMDYTFGTEDKVVYYLVIDVTSSAFVNSTGGRWFFGILIGILVIVMTPLWLIISKDIIRPVRKLEQGVKQIKDGNLDFKLETDSKTEMGDVVESFDAMRQELKNSIEKQIKFEENRKELISSISHDLKTPIASIKGHVEGIMDGIASSPEKLDKYLSVIYQKSRDMDQLIDELFLLSKLDLNRLPFEKKEIKVIPFLDAIKDEMQLGWESDNNSIVIHYEDSVDDETTFVADQVQIKRVFVNIIQNAMKYMDKDEHKIDIEVTAFSKIIKFKISDNGQGIPEDQVPYIFDMFYRVDESRNSTTGGSGLGLAISKQIVEQHEGTINVSSKLGVGTQIIIVLPKKIEVLHEENINY
ncbi:MAG: HAMP domain-containing histidine kinase [Clostridiales bacterium]|nr:HAMP domain-containing histidine kinase [Clostridiales bacterium]